MKKNYFIIVTGITLLVSCGSDEIKVKDGKLSVSDVKTVAEKMNKEAEKAKDHREERRAKGDTLAMPYKDLQAYLPDVGDYVKNGGPKGSQMNMPSMGSWSQVEQRYTNGDKKLSVKIIDYNASHMGFSGVTALYRMGFSSEDDNKKQGSVDLGIKEVAAYETVYKQKPNAQLVLIIADRFFVEIESRGSNDMDMLSAIAKHMAASGLAEK
jgi:hypothetical protein